MVNKFVVHNKTPYFCDTVPLGVIIICIKASPPPPPGNHKKDCPSNCELYANTNTPAGGRAVIIGNHAIPQIYTYIYTQNTVYI